MPRKTSGTYGRSRGGEEDQRAEVGSALVGESAGSVDESTNTVGLDGGADEGSAPGGGGRGGLLRLEELLLGVGGLSLAVGVAEDRAEDGKGDGVVVDGAEGDRGGLDGREVCRRSEVSLVILLQWCALRRWTRTAAVVMSQQTRSFQPWTRMRHWGAGKRTVKSGHFGCCVGDEGCGVCVDVDVFGDGKEEEEETGR